jgi:type IV pilus assembly protein PilB
MEFVRNKTLEKLKYDLVRDNIIKYEDLETAEQVANAQRVNIGQVLISSGIISEEKLLKFLESKLHIPYVNLEDYSLDKKCLNYINFNNAQKYKVIPLFEIEGILTVAMSDPLDLFAIDKIIEDAKCEIEPVISSESAVLKKIEEYYQSTGSVGQIFIDENKPQYDWREILNNNNVSNNLTDEHIQKLIRAILQQAISENVHELFFEHIPNGLNVIFKKNSENISTGEIPSILIAPFVAKLKTLSNLDPTVSELPQLGKLSFKAENIALIASISAFPTIHGERISIKIYKPPRELKTVINDEKKCNIIRNAMNESGIILVCGSSLSGKTHVIYSILSDIASKNKNVMTIESITKYDLPNVNQCELNEHIGFNLDKAMRFIEFQTPDILYFEGINTKEGLDYFTSLVFNNKTLITEFLAENIADLMKKFSLSDFSTFKSMLSCLVFIHSKNSIEIFDKKALEKYFV